MAAYKENAGPVPQQENITVLRSVAFERYEINLPRRQRTISQSKSKSKPVQSSPKPRSSKPAEGMYPQCSPDSKNTDLILVSHQLSEKKNEITGYLQS